LSLGRYRTLNDALSLSNLSLIFKGPKALINSSIWGFYKLSGILRSSAQSGLYGLSQPKIRNIFKSKGLLSFVLKSKLALRSTVQLSGLDSIFIAYRIASFRSKLVPINIKSSSIPRTVAAF